MIPQKILINRIEDYHTHFMGMCDNLYQFWGYLTFVMPKDLEESQKEEWGKYRKEYIILHIFDIEGNLISTEWQFAGFTNEINDDLLEKVLETWINSLGNYIKYCNISIKLFTVYIENTLFGLIPNNKTNTIDLWPSFLIQFQEPWNGEYYT